jgi:hypothetical protein
MATYSSRVVHFRVPVLLQQREGERKKRTLSLDFASPSEIADPSSNQIHSEKTMIRPLILSPPSTQQ